MSAIRWSNSSLSLLQNCSEAYRRRYIEKEWSPPSPRMIRGTVVHRSAARAHYRKMLDGELVSVEEAKDLAASDFDSSWRGGIVLNEEESARGVVAVRDASKDFAIDLSGYHVETIMPAARPIAVERKITVQPKDSDLVIHGIIDLIDQTPTGEQIRDLKTSEKSPFADAAEKSQQLSMYGLIRMAEVGTLPERFTLDTLVRTPVKAEKKHVQQHTTRDGDDMRALVNRINTAVAAVQKGLFVPADPSHWMCSKAYCTFWDTCPYTRRSDRPKS